MRRFPFDSWKNPYALALAAVAVWALGMGMPGAAAQDGPNVHWWHQPSPPPGAFGTRQLTRGGPLPGYFQPVEFKGPAGMTVALAMGGNFSEPQPVPARAALLIGSVYRLRVTNIPLNPGLEVFPTIELVNRLYPPRGQERRFSIPIELTLDDLELALSGKFVTRVVYLEDPRNATPAAPPPGGQSWFEVGPGRDPLVVADVLGRPMAIVRLGARVPDSSQGFTADFLYGSPPWLRVAPPGYAMLPQRPPAPQEITTPPQSGPARPATSPAAKPEKPVL